jgi:hypothetical protein
MVDEQPGRTEDSVDLDIMLDLATPWCLRVAATLRLTEHIAAGPPRPLARHAPPP